MGHEPAGAVRAPSAPRTGRPQGLLGGRHRKPPAARARAASHRRCPQQPLSTISELPELTEPIHGKHPAAAHGQGCCDAGQGLTRAAMMRLPALDLAQGEAKLGAAGGARAPQPERSCVSPCGLQRSQTIASDDEWAKLLIGALFRPAEELCEHGARGDDGAQWMDTSKRVLLSLLPPARASGPAGEGQHVVALGNSSEKTTTDPVEPKKPETICSQKRPNFAGRSLSARRLVMSASLEM